MNFTYGPPPTGYPAPAPWTLPPMPNAGYPAPPAPPPFPAYDVYAPYGAPVAPASTPSSPPMQAQRGGPELIYAVIVTVAQKIWGRIKAVFGG